MPPLPVRPPVFRTVLAEAAESLPALRRNCRWGGSPAAAAAARLGMLPQSAAN